MLCLAFFCWGSALPPRSDAALEALGGLFCFLPGAVLAGAGDSCSPGSVVAAALRSRCARGLGAAVSLVSCAFRPAAAFGTFAAGAIVSAGSPDRVERFEIAGACPSSTA